MALVKATLQAQLLQVFTEMRNEKEISDAKLAEKLASAIDTYIRSAQVAQGIPVATAGSPTAQTGATTGPGSLM